MVIHYGDSALGRAHALFMGISEIENLPNAAMTHNTTPKMLMLAPLIMGTSCMVFSKFISCTAQGIMPTLMAPKPYKPKAIL